MRADRFRPFPGSLSIFIVLLLPVCAAHAGSSQTFVIENPLRLLVEEEERIPPQGWILRSGEDSLVLRSTITLLQPGQRLSFHLPHDWNGREGYWEPGPRSARVIGPKVADSAWDQGTRKAFWKGIIWIGQIVFQTVLFCLPGLAFYAVVRRVRPLNPAFLLPSVLAASGLMAFLLWGVFVLSSFWGGIANYVIWAISLAVLFTPNISSPIWSQIRRWENTFPILLWIAGSLFIAGLGYGLDWETTATRQASQRFAVALPIDNELPVLTATVFADGLHISPFTAGWQISDRPPLQSAFILFFSPYYFDGWDSGAAATSLLLQTLLLPALAIASRFWGLSPAASAGLLAATAFSSLFIFHSVYFWPKLLAAAWILLAVGLLFPFGPRLRGTGLPFPGWLTGLLIALAFLSHGSTLFAVLGLLPLCLAFSRTWPFRGLMKAVLTALLLLSPWLVFQKQVDPPGDRLVKWHLAGFPEGREGSVWEALKEGYRDQTFQTWLEGRAQQVKTLLGDWSSFPRWIKEGPAALAWNVQAQSFLSQFFVLGIMNLGWFAALFPGTWKIRETETLMPSVIRLTALICLLAGLFTTIVWMALMFIPNRALLHQAAFFQPVVLLVGLYLTLRIASPRLALFILLAHCVAGLFIWVMPPLFWLSGDMVFALPPARWPLVVAGAAGGMFILGLLGISGSRKLDRES